MNGIDQNTILLCGFGRELDYARQGILYQQITQMTKDINQAGRWRTGSFTDADDEFDFMLFKSKFLGNPAFSAEQILEQAAADRNKITLCAEALIKKAIEIAFFLRGPYAASGVEGEESIKKKIDVILNQASGVSKEELENIEHRVARARQPSMILSPI